MNRLNLRNGLSLIYGVAQARFTDCHELSALFRTPNSLPPQEPCAGTPEPSPEGQAHIAVADIFGRGLVGKGFPYVEFAVRPILNLHSLFPRLTVSTGGDRLDRINEKDKTLAGMNGRY
jgi:hypothetical protein